MSASNLAGRARDDGLHGQKNLLSLLIIYSTTALMTAAVYFVAYLAVFNPLSATSSVISIEIPKLQIGKGIMQTFKQKTPANNALSTVPVNTSEADAHNV